MPTTALSSYENRRESLEGQESPASESGSHPSVFVPKTFEAPSDCMDVTYMYASTAYDGV